MRLFKMRPLFFVMMKKIIVTGSEGFIGKALCRELSKRGVEVIGIDRKNGTEASNVHELLKKVISTAYFTLQHKQVFSMKIWSRSGKITLIPL